ncbi:MAG TPA: ABC transporter substrate-binding protein [bacterium]|nr:ABC transporter substrate-binding protein [bacterium]
MKVRGRWVALGLALVVGIALMPGAVGAQSSVTLVFNYPVGVAGPLNQLMTAMVNDFNDGHPAIKVVPAFAGNYVQATAAVIASTLGGRAPALFVLDTPEVFSLLDQHAIIPLDSLVAENSDKAWMHDFYDKLLLNNVINGHVYSIPWQRSTPIMFYNTDLFRQAGLDPNRPPTTWAQLVTDAQKLTVRDASGRVTQWGVEAPVVDTSPWVFQGFLIEAGANYFDTTAGKWVKYNSPQAVRALQFILDLQNKYKVAPPGPSGKPFWDQVPQDFIQRRTAIIYTTTGGMTFIRKNAKFAWNAAFMPADIQYGAPTGGGSFYISGKVPPDQVKAAWAFIQWMTEPAQAARWSIGTGYVPIRKSELRVPMFADYLKQVPQALVATRQLAVAGEQMTIHDQDEVQQFLVTAVQAAQSGRLSVQAALDQAQSQADAALQKYR